LLTWKTASSSRSPETHSFCKVEIVSLWGKTRDIRPRALVPERASDAPSVDPRGLSVVAATRTLPAGSAGDLAWVAAVPCALLTLAAAVLLGPPLGRALFAPGTVHFLIPGIMPEPTEHARFVIAALAPMALGGLLLAVGGRRGAATARWRRAAHIAQAALLAFAALTLIALRVWTYGGLTAEWGYQFRVYFTPATIVVALAVAAGIVALLRSDALVERLRALAHETRARRTAGLAIALLFTAIWLLTAFNTEGTIGLTNLAVLVNFYYWPDEVFAVLNGAVPLVDFHAQYMQLWPWVTAGAMALFGTTLAVFCGVMIAATMAVMTAVYATLRRVVGSSLIALALFAPFLATSFFKMRGTLENRYGPANLFSLFPVRFGGPYVLAWLMARRLDGARPRSATLLFLFAGLVLINNPEFGVPAFAATVAALLLTLPDPTPRAAARLLGEVVLGTAGALAAVALLTLIAAGSLPDYTQALEFSRLVWNGGMGLMPMPGFGFHYAIYVTFAGAIVLAVVRTVDRQRDVVLTALLCWVGLFGLGASTYFVGRSHPEMLISVFSSWALALALLLVAAVRAIRARPRRLPTAAELAVLIGFGLAVCSIAQTPTPWSQVTRLQHTTKPAVKPLAAEQFVRAHTHPGEHVMIAVPLGHWIAYDVGIVDDFPYTNTSVIPTKEQWMFVLHRAQREHIRSLFLPATPIVNELSGVVRDLRADGYQLGAVGSPEAQIVQFVR
jgi:hypothetical protein